MAKLSLLTFLFCSISFASPKVTFVKKWEIAASTKVDKKKIGGLSGCSYRDGRIYTVSDDRGGFGGPRVISFLYDVGSKELDLRNPTSLKVKYSTKVIDLEGIGIRDKNSILLSSEGDLNQKPRVMPDLFWIDSSGRKVKSIQIPAEFLPEKSGKQTKGIQNNLGFEGLVVDVEAKIWAAILEAPLVQAPGSLRLVESSLDSVKFDRTFNYPLPEDLEPETVSSYFGATDLLRVDDSSFLILERGVEASLQGITFRTQLCIAKKGTTNSLNRECVYSMNTDSNLSKDLPQGANFEGLCWVNKQQKQFIAVSDNNFSKNEKSVLILYQLN